MSTARLPRVRPSILPSWTELPSLMRIAIGVAVGMAVILALRSLA